MCEVCGRCAGGGQHAVRMCESVRRDKIQRNLYVESYV